MIKFFRKIRQKLLSENKFSKYLLYALGEIALVVIGILIALSINNWNEEKKRNEKERNILAEIKRDIDETNSEVVNDMIGHLKMLIDAQRFKGILKEKKTDFKIVGQYYRQLSRDLQVYPKTNAFETLKSQGLEIISTDSLRTSISNLYQLDYTRLTKFGRLTPEHNIIEMLLPYTLRHFKITDDNTRKIELEEFDESITFQRPEIKSVDNLKNDEEFFIILEETMQLRSYKIALHRTALENGVKVIEYINANLNTGNPLEDGPNYDLSETLVGEWKSEQMPEVTLSFYKENGKLYSTENITKEHVKYFILSESRLYSEKGLYAKMVYHKGEYELHSSKDIVWKRIKD